MAEVPTHEPAGAQLALAIAEFWKKVPKSRETYGQRSMSVVVRCPYFLLRLPLLSSKLLLLLLLVFQISLSCLGRMNLRRALHRIRRSLGCWNSDRKKDT